MKIELTKLPWMDEKEFDNLKRDREKFKTYCNEYKNDKNMEKYSEEKFIFKMVIDSNKFENTLPIGVDLENISLKIKIGITPWNADGNADSNESQLVQHMEAYYYLQSQKELTFDVILEAHGILMLKAITDKGHSVLNGGIRTFGVNNGVDNYLPHEQIEEHLKQLLTWYGNTKNSDPVETAYKLFWEFLKIHPFEDGNGRIARLLVTYHLCHSATPFPVTITSGKRRSRKHYHDAIKKGDLLYSNRTDLYTLISYSVYLGWKEFFENEDRVECGIL